jgi:Flp pilus assembly protein TadG
LTRSSRYECRRRGSTLVEFSISVFLLLMIMFGVIELQRMLFVYNTIADSARAGVRYAIVHGFYASPASGPANNDTNVINVVKTFAGASLLDTSKLGSGACPIPASGGICVKYAPSLGSTGTTATNTPGSLVTVSVSYPYDPFVGWFSSLLGVNLTATSQGAVVY